MALRIIKTRREKCHRLKRTSETQWRSVRRFVHIEKFTDDAGSGSKEAVEGGCKAKTRAEKGFACEDRTGCAGGSAPSPHEYVFLLSFVFPA